MTLRVDPVLLFFDIDGTLIDNQGAVPASAQLALRLAKRNGHKLFLCTGRPLPTIPEGLAREYGFDGIVASGGASISCDGKVIYQFLMDREKLKQYQEFCEKHRYIYAVQGSKHNYTAASAADRMRAVADNHEVVMSLGENYREKMVVFDDILEIADDAEKLSFFYVDDDIDVASKALGEYFHVMPFYPVKAAQNCGEIQRTGVDKALGVIKIADYYHEPIEHTIALGDGPNDIEILRAAHVGVCMANGTEETKQAADMVTDAVDNDGLYKAMKRLNLI